MSFVDTEVAEPLRNPIFSKLDGLFAEMKQFKFDGSFTPSPLRFGAADFIMGSCLSCFESECEP